MCTPMLHRDSVLLAMAFSLVPCILVLAAGPSAASEYSADLWEQWRPARGPGDPRLEAAMTLDAPDSTLEQLFDRMSEESGVILSSADELLAVRIDVLADDRSVEGLMVALAELLDARWLLPRGAAAHPGQYRLVPRDHVAASADDLLQQHVEALRRADAREHRAERVKRLSDLEAALGLTPTELLGQAGTSDPWLCADLLDPALRPMIKQVLHLAPDQRESLLAAGELALRLRDFDEPLQHHLAYWTKGRWDLPSTVTPIRDPDWLPRFTDASDRWINSVVALWWRDNGLQYDLTIPDLGGFSTTIVHLPSVSPLGARRKLAELGYCEDTEEYRQTAQEEAERWAAAVPSGPAVPPGPQPSYSPLSREPNRSHPCLTVPLNLDCTGTDALSTADALREIAERCGIGVVANYIPPRLASVSCEELGSPGLTAGSVLEKIRRQRAGAFWWDFRGPFLVAGDSAYRLVELSAVPQGLLEAWAAKTRPGSVLGLVELSSALSSLPDLQIAQLVTHVPGMDKLPVHRLKVYGLLDSSQRRGLADSDGLGFLDLTEHQRRAVLRLARAERPWLQSSHLSDAVLRTTPRRLSTGEEGVSFIIEYGFPDAPADRDVVFTAPLRFVVGEDGFIG